MKPSSYTGVALSLLLGWAALPRLDAQAPQLSISPSAGREAVVLSWPATAQTFVLEVAEGLTDAAGWRSVADQAVLANNTLRLQLGAGSKASFFRLRQAGRSLPPTDFSISGYTLVSSTPFGAAGSERTYRANVGNRGATDATVSATLISASANVTILNNTLGFGDVQVGETATAADTFVLRYADSAPFEGRDLVWVVQATALPPTSFELIDAALKAGLIDAETALVYQVYVEFDEDLLPPAYRGRDDQTQEAKAIAALEDRFQTLSPATQRLLIPFLMQPNTPGSWYERKHARVIQVATALAAAPILWGHVDTTNGKVRIWWDSERKSPLEAQRIADEIDSTIWPKLTGLLGEPLPDTDKRIQMPDGTDIVDETDDERLDIFLTDSSRVYTAVRKACMGHTQAAFINLGVHRSFPSIVHELTHAILYRFPLKTGCDNSNYKWLHDATAEWAKDYIYPTGNDEAHNARYFLAHPEWSLDYQEAGGPAHFQHPYGAYLWFLFLTRHQDAAAHFVRETWDACATQNSRDAIEQSIQRQGGFHDVWPQFALYNWNRTGNGHPYRYYFEWDKLDTQAAETEPNPKKPALNGESFKAYPLNYLVPNLAAVYFHYDLTGDPTIRSLTFSHPYFDGQTPGASVQAIVKIRGQEWKDAEDWTKFPRKRLCRDLPEEDFEELVIVISNSESKSTDKILGGLNESAELRVSVFGCELWEGTVKQTYTSTTSQAVETLESSADLTFVYDDAASEGGVGFPKIYTLHKGHFSYSQRFDYRSGGCRLLTTAGGAIPPNPYVAGLVQPTTLSLIFIPDVPFPGETGVHYYGSGGTAVDSTQLDNCNQEGVDRITRMTQDLTLWTASEGGTSTDGKTLQGQQDISDDQGGAYHWTWQFSRK